MKQKIMFLFTIVIIGVFYWFWKRQQQQKQETTTNSLNIHRNDGWFGRSVDGNDQNDDQSIRPFKIEIDDQVLTDLRHRLQQTRYIDHVEQTQFTYGFNTSTLRSIVDYWLNSYDWRREESELNRYEQYKTRIEGIDIHFVRVKPSSAKVRKSIPLLVIHGWPGSVWEYYKSFPLLTEPDDDGVAFEVIAPSIPGYGYSEAAHQKGIEIFHSFI